MLFRSYMNPSQDPEIWTIQMEWADNPFLDKQEIEAMSSVLSEEQLQSRRYGHFLSFGGLVYPEFDTGLHIVQPFEIPAEWYDNISIDPGLHNPLSAHWYAVDYDGNIWVIAEHYFSGKSLEWHAQKIREKCEELRWPQKSDGKIQALIDSAANQKTLSGEKSVAELFFDNGILVNTKVNKDLFSGISRVKSYLKNIKGESRIRIFATCTNLIREIKNYWWGDNDVPIKKDDHALDELRYYIMSRPETPSRSEQKTEVQKHKEKLMQKVRINRKIRR